METLKRFSGDEDAAQLQSKLSSANWHLTASALGRFVERFLENELTPSQLEEIGDLLESEAVTYDDDDGSIAQVLFEMSSPEVNGPVNDLAAQRWLEILEPRKDA